MNQLLIQGADNGTVPFEIVYIPEGEHAIRPNVDGKPGDVLVRLSPHRGHEIAAAFQRDLVRRQGENVRAILDYDHRASGAAAGLPKSFSYRPGFGLILAVDWTNTGRVAVEGRDYSRSAPFFEPRSMSFCWCLRFPWMCFGAEAAAETHSDLRIPRG